MPDLHILAHKLGVEFKDLSLLERALTHSSYAFERRSDANNNERLEFLGDAVLELAVSDYLFKCFPRMTEGEMTKRRASVVCERTLANQARACGLPEYLLLGRGEAGSGGRQRASIISDAFEAVIGAIYIDQGLDSAKALVERLLAVDIDNAERARDFKSELQEHVQNVMGCPSSAIEYTVTCEHGPDHDKCYEVSLNVTGRNYGQGTGRSKKLAEQNAAQQALDVLENNK